jgi:hypothetical protein
MSSIDNFHMNNLIVFDQQLHCIQLTTSMRLYPTCLIVSVQNMEYPRHIIDPQGKLYHDDNRLGIYQPVKKAPRLKPQNIGHNELFATTLDGKLFDMDCYRVIELEDPSVIIDRVILGIFHGNESISPENDRTVILSEDRTLYYVYVNYNIESDEVVGKLTNLADNVVHCSATAGNVLASDTEGNVISVDITCRRLQENEHPLVYMTTLKRQVKRIINGIMITDEGFYSTIMRGNEAKFMHKRWNKPIDDIISSYDYTFNGMDITGFYIISEGKLYQSLLSKTTSILPIDNSIIQKIETETPWVKLIPLECPQIGIVNTLGEVYVMNDTFVNKMDIDSNLLKSNNSKNARRIE